MVYSLLSYAKDSDVAKVLSLQELLIFVRWKAKGGGKGQQRRKGWQRKRWISDWQADGTAGSRPEYWSADPARNALCRTLQPLQYGRPSKVRVPRIRQDHERTTSGRNGRRRQG